MVEKNNDRNPVLEALRFDDNAELARLHITGERLGGVDSKQAIRDAYQPKRSVRSINEYAFVAKYAASMLPHFAEGNDINPARIAPKLVFVERPDSLEGRLFRFATLLWSVPVSRGYGRRLRYLIIDGQNNKLMGIFALGDPVINMRARDQEIGWNIDDRTQRLYHVMDAYVLGAVPPYNDLLVGKLVALATTTNEVRQQFRVRYRKTQTIINGGVKKADLVLVTTTSSLGRSSIYNRLHLAEGVGFSSIGFTSGYGHFHISDDLFVRMRDFLRDEKDGYADGNRYGDGPNWRMRTIRKALCKLEIDDEEINHGIRREIFLAPLASNYKQILKGEAKRPDYCTLPFRTVFNEFKERWLIPRSQRIDRWKNWSLDMLRRKLELDTFQLHQTKK